MPSNFDRALCTLFGTKAVELIAEGRYGEMVSFAPPQMTSVPIAQAIGRCAASILGHSRSLARALGTCLGD